MHSRYANIILQQLPPATSSLSDDPVACMDVEQEEIRIKEGECSTTEEALIGLGGDVFVY